MPFPEPEPERKKAEYGFLALFVGGAILYGIVRLILALIGV